MLILGAQILLGFQFGRFGDGYDQLPTDSRYLSGVALGLMICVTLLHGSVVRRRGLEGISGPRFLTLGRHRAIQSEPRSPSSHPEAAAQSDELGGL